MPAASTDKFKKGARKWVGQIGAGGVSDDTTATIPLASATGLPTDTAVVAVIDRVDSSGTKTPSLEETVIGVVSGSSLVTATRGAEGTAQAHSAGAVVEILITNKGWNDMVDGILVGHNQDGTHKSGLTFTLPQINDTSSDHQYILSVCELVADRTVALPLLTGDDEFVFKAHTQTLTNKTLTSPTINTGTLVSPVLNTAVSGTAVLDEDNMASNSATQLATQQSIKAYADSVGTASLLKSKVITATRDMTAASGNVAYTGVGFVPTSITAIFCIETKVYAGTGFADSARTSGNVRNDSSTNTAINADLICLTSATGGFQEATVASYDADGFTLTWTKTATPSGTMKITFICYR